MALQAVIIDSREPDHMRSLTVAGILASIQALPCGDAWLLCQDAHLVIERKTPTDFLASIADGRLFEQCAKISAMTKWGYLAITGYLAARGGLVIMNGKTTQWKMSSVQGALLAVQELGIQIVHCSSDRQYVALLERLARRKRGEIKIKPQRRDAVLQSPSEAFLCALPGISEKRAGDLLVMCGTPAAALEFLSSLQPKAFIPGIGKGTKKATRRVLGLEENQELAVLTAESENDNE